MTLSRAIKSVFLVTVSPRVCKCVLPAKELFQTPKLANAIKVADGYYQLFLDFFGEQAPWLEFTVVDTRDGQVMWRNGRPMKEEKDNG